MAEQLPSRINQEILSCLICSKEYTIINLPKLLPCSHTFCQACIQAVINKSKSRAKAKFTCVQCCKTTRVVGGATKLQNNATVMSLMDMVQLVPDTSQCTSLKHEATSPERAESSETHKCCRCIFNTAVHAVKCGHRICDRCKQQDTMDVATPCQLCMNIQHGIDYFSENNPPLYCQHATDLRPSPVNPGYHESGYSNTDLILTTIPSGYEQRAGKMQAGYIDNAHGIHNAAFPHCIHGSDIYCTDCNIARVNGAAPGYNCFGYDHNVQNVVKSSYMNGESEFTPPLYMPATSCSMTSLNVTGYNPHTHYGASLAQEFVSRLNIEGDPPSGIRSSPQPHSHTYMPATYTQSSRVQADLSIATVPIATGTQMLPITPALLPAPVVVPSNPPEGVPQIGAPIPIPYMEVDPLEGPSHGRSHSPPPAYSEIDQHQVGAPPVPVRQSPAERRKPKSKSTTHAEANRSSNPEIANDAAPRPQNKKSKAKVKATSESGQRESPPPSQPARSSPPAPIRGGVAVFPEALHRQEQSVASGEGSHAGTVRDNGNREHVITSIPQMEKLAPPSRQAPRPPSENRSPHTSMIDVSTSGQVPLPLPDGPAVPPRRLAGEPQGLPFKCIQKFGRYSDAKMQSGAFQKPKRVSMSSFGQVIVVTDTQEMTVQLFNPDGSYVYKFKVLGVEGACMYTQNKLAVATHRGVEIYSKNGHLESDTAIGPCMSTIPYKYGFLAVRQKSLVFFNPNGKQTSELLKRRTKSSAFKKFVNFEQIKDAAVSMAKDIAVLEISGDVYIMDDEGNVKFVIQPQNEPCGKILDPFSVTFDRWSNIFISDIFSRKVLRFSPNGKFSRCVLNFTLGETSTTVNSLKAYGICASSEADHLLTVICGEKCAEVRIYKLY